jgi:hypothetical protein
MAEEVKFYPAYWGGKKLSYPNVSAESPKFANSVVAGNLILVSGCQGLVTRRSHGDAIPRAARSPRAPERHRRPSPCGCPRDGCSVSRPAGARRPGQRRDRSCR